ncbi:sigma-54-dependent Fis family transcriptional regulator [Candidatus Woesearchaeota archaeon]|nr:sigma-54-dependent Fis family transcriptional regulator [Candidatus Woesearchaeota archaeon]
MVYLVADYAETGLAIGSNNGHLVGTSNHILGLVKTLERIANFPTPVLITGETGTGKEVVAKALHYNSFRRYAPFVTVNCAAIPRDLLESELFGHKKGSFTGATSDRSGKFEAANTGTLFLDEIGDMSPDLQAKILRVLEDRKVTRVGSTAITEVDVRVVSATNHDLEACIKEGRFRQDLFYRLNTYTLGLAPLRDRRQDILPLLSYFIKQYNDRYSNHGVSLEGISEEALELLQCYSWPGNVRELRSVVERFALDKRRGIIEVEDIPDKFKRTVKSSRAQGNLPSWYSFGVKPYLLRDLCDDGRFMPDRSNLRRKIDTNPQHFKTERIGSETKGIKVVYLTPFNFYVLLGKIDNEAQLYDIKVRLFDEIINDDFNDLIIEPFAIYSAGRLNTRYGIPFSEMCRTPLMAKGIYVVSAEMTTENDYRAVRNNCFALRLSDLEDFIPRDLHNRTQVTTELGIEIRTRYACFKEGNFNG